MVALTVEPLDFALAEMITRRLYGATSSLPESWSTDQRVLYTTIALLSVARARGHSCITLSTWAGRSLRLELAASGDQPVRAVSCELPALDAWQALLQPSIAGTDGPLVLDGPRLYLRRFYDAETALAEALRMRLDASLSVDDGAMERMAALAPLFQTLFPQSATVFDRQALAAVVALRSPVAFITGGPGTGKTTVTAKLLTLLLADRPNVNVVLCAPTGRAAARLADSMRTAVQALDIPDAIRRHLPTQGGTIHRLLGYRPSTDRFTFGADRPLAADVVVIDEASMVDILLMRALVSALKPSARLIVLGDPDQLASVDTGSVLGDIVRAARSSGPTDGTMTLSAAVRASYRMLAGAAPLNMPPTVTAATAMAPLQDALVVLERSHRFGTRPGIGALATASRFGHAEEAEAILDSPDYPDVQARWDDVSGAGWLEPMQPWVTALLATTTPAAALEALGRFRILCGLREGSTGVVGINAAVERWLRRSGHATAGWYRHRPVLITSNEPALQLYNGDVGILLEDEGEMRAWFPAEDGGVRGLLPTRLPAHETAWGMTIHKSQGSEFDHVLLVLPEQDTRVLTRELLYTAITRAKVSVTVTGRRELLARALRRTVDRTSGLVDRLR